MTTLQATNLVKSYRRRKVLQGVSIGVDSGEVVGLLGPNGAGKTTLINIVCGIVNSSGGTIRVGGHDIRSEARAARDLIGLVPHDALGRHEAPLLICVEF
jgi:ABC-2 type transport system ATP-binding protein